jgi:hypothetical protein
LGFLRIWAAVVVLAGSLTSHAESLTVEVEAVRVFAEPTASSTVVTTLFKGDVVPLSKKYQSSSFKKVLVKVGDTRRPGYVLSAELEGRVRPQGKVARPAGRRPLRAERRTALHDRNAVGLLGGVHYQYQGERSYTDPSANGSTVAFSSLAGLGQEFGLFMVFPFSQTMKLKTYLEYKSVAVQGTAQVSSSLVPTLPSDAFLKETFISLGGQIEMYPSRATSFWYGGGLRADFGTGGSLKIGSYDAVTLSSSDIPRLYYLYAALGGDFGLSRDWFLIPEIHMGAIFNVKPLIIEADVLIGIGYAY